LGRSLVKKLKFGWQHCKDTKYKVQTRSIFTYRAEFIAKWGEMGSGAN